MPTANDKFLRYLLQTCAACAPEPLYPMRFARELNLDRETLDAGLDELRRRGLVQFTEWVKDAGQGYALTDAGRQALVSGQLPMAGAVATDLPAEGSDTLYDRGEIVRRAVFAPQPPFVSRLLLAANLLFFFFGAFYAWKHDLDVSDYLQGNSPAPKLTTDRVLVELGALHHSLVLPRDPQIRPEFERILLFSFLHIGLIHLFMNMYFLYSLGPLIESVWGWPRFLAIYFIAGVVSGCVILLFTLTQDRSGYTAGASGNLYGIFIALLVWFWFNRQHLPERLIQDWSRNFATNAFLLFAINFLPFPISWQGHLGGAIGGLLAALLLHVQRFHPAVSVRLLALAALPFVPIGFFVAMLYHAGWF